MNTPTPLPALSVPPAFVLPRPLHKNEIDTLRAVAEVLIPTCGDRVGAASEPGFDAALITAATARADAFGDIAAILAQWRDLRHIEFEREVRALHDQQPDTFQALSAVIAGAWLILPAVRRRIGYPGQHRNPAPLDQAVEELTNGLLDEVVARGSIYRVVPPA